MKIKNNYVLRKVADSFVVVPVGEEVSRFNGMITLNEPGALMWRGLEKGADEEKLVFALTSNYDVDEVTARRDIKNFIKKLIDAEIIESP